MPGSVQERGPPVPEQGRVRQQEQLPERARVPGQGSERVQVLPGLQQGVRVPGLLPARTLRRR